VKKEDEKKIEVNDFVIVVIPDHNPPIRCWGLVTSRFPSGNLNVQIEDAMTGDLAVIIAKPENLLFVRRTQGEFSTPSLAFAWYNSELALENTLYRILNRETRALLRIERKIARRSDERRQSWLQLFHLTRKPKSPPGS